MRALHVGEYLKRYAPQAMRRLTNDTLETRLAECMVRADATDAEGRIVTAVVTDPTEDSYGEVIAAGAFDASLPAFMRNPVILPCHARWIEGGRCPAIGKAIEVRSDGDSLLARIQFADFGLGVEEYWPAYEGGYLRAFSVGFRAETIEQRKGAAPTHTKAQLKEISAVALPANPNALVTQFLRSQPEATESDAAWRRIEQELGELRNTLAELRGDKHMDVRSRMDRTIAETAAARAALRTL